VAYLWQVALHSWIAGFIFYVWMNRLRLPSGRPRRRLFMLLLTLPLVTAAIPGRGAIEFGERIAWLNSARLLAIPLFGQIQLGDAVLVLFALVTALTLWQVLIPGGSGLPRLTVPKPAEVELLPEEVEIVDALDRAQARQRLPAYVMFVIRLLQCYNPIAMWAFREYRVEVHAACDAVAVAGHDPRTLARVLLRLYQTVHGRDGSSRNLLRRRVDVLLAGGPHDAALPTATIVVVAVFLILVLPWIV
jgi:hypothetical protein